MKRSAFILMNVLFYSLLSIMCLGIGVILERIVFSYNVYISISNSIFSLLFFFINYSGILLVFREKNVLIIKAIEIHKGEVLSIAICASVIITILQFTRISLSIIDMIINEIILLVLTPSLVLVINKVRPKNSKA